MKKTKDYGLYKVLWIHRSGKYQSPNQFLTGTSKQVREKILERGSLNRFFDSWMFEIEKVEKIRNVEDL